MPGWRTPLNADPLDGRRVQRNQITETLALVAVSVLVLGIPAAGACAGLGFPVSTAAAVACSVVVFFNLLPVALRTVIGTHPRIRSRYLAAAGSAAYLVSVSVGGFWSSIADAVLSFSLLAVAVHPQLVDLIPDRAKFDWAGARAEGFNAPSGSSFEYPFRSVAISFLGVPFAVRGFMACVQAVHAYSNTASTLPAVSAALGSGLGYLAFIALLISAIPRES